MRKKKKMKNVFNSCNTRLYYTLQLTVFSHGTEDEPSRPAMMDFQWLLDIPTGTHTEDMLVYNALIITVCPSWFTSTSCLQDKIYIYIYIRKKENIH